MVKLFKMNFTKKCILMSVISQEKNITLVNSFHNIPLVKLYTANINDENFIYSKIKGALCFFVKKEQNSEIFYLKIYDIQNFSIVFNMELKKEQLQFFIQYSDDFYFMQLRESLIGFKFKSKLDGKNFHSILNEKPKIEILEQNEKSKIIKSKEIIKTINKVNDSIKLKLKEKFQFVQKKGGGLFSKKVDNFDNMKINDKKGEYLDLSKIPQIYFFLKNIEISDILGKMIIFPDIKFPKILCQNYVFKYDNSFDFNSKTAPLKIIEKDFLNILNKKLYINLLVNNMINDMKMHERLDIFKKEHIKRNKKKAGYKLGLKKTIKSFGSKKTKDLSSRHLSRVSSESSLLEANYNSEKGNDMRSSISSNSGLSGLYNTEDQPKIKKKDKYTNDRKSISELVTASFENIIDSDDDNNSNQAGFSYFKEEKKKKSTQTQKKLPAQKTLKKSISSDYILGDKNKSKRSKKKAEELANFLGGDSMAIPEIDEDEGDNKNNILNTEGNKQVKNTLYINNNFKSKINMSSKTSLTGFLMTTNKLGKNKK